MEKIYLDHNATTPVDPKVASAMMPYLTDEFGNASSVHNWGRDAKVVMENCREQIAAMINCKPSELYFTSGGTESDNMAILGTAYQYKKRKRHLVVGAAEHHAVLEPAEFLRDYEQFELDFLGVDDQGFSSAAELSNLLRDDTALVSVMHGNNETGAIQDIKALASVTKERKILFHTDAVQSIGKVAVDVQDLGVDLLSLTGHKIYGPKGTGAFFIREGVKIAPLFHGGSHEKKRRPGTESIAGIVGLAKCLEIAEKLMEQDNQRLSELSDYFIKQVTSTIADTRINSPVENRVPQTVNMSFIGTEGESLILSMDLKGIAASSGSACTSGATEPSHVLTAMKVPAIEAQGAVRFSLGRSTTKEQLDYVVCQLPEIVDRLRELSPIYNRR